MHHFQRAGFIWTINPFNHGDSATLFNLTVPDCSRGVLLFLEHSHIRLSHGRLAHFTADPVAVMRPVRKSISPSSAFNGASFDIFEVQGMAAGRHVEHCVESD
jgi:hypothetical protein